MTFTISNLKTGDLVICKNGKMATVMKNTGREDVLRFHTDYNSFSRLNVNYNDDLTNKRADGLTIVKVMRAIDVEPSDIGDLVYNPDEMREGGTVVYDRDAESDNKITIDSLKTGDMLVHANGKVSTVFKGADFGDITRYHTSNDSFSYLRRFNNETLKHESNSDYDIVAVYRTSVDDPTKFGDDYCNRDKMIVEANKIYPVADAATPSDYTTSDKDITMNYADFKKRFNEFIDDMIKG